jgi:hypothetical protein
MKRNRESCIHTELESNMLDLYMGCDELSGSITTYSFRTGEYLLTKHGTPCVRKRDFEGQSI